MAKQEHIGELLLLSGFWPTYINTISGIFVVQQVRALIREGYKVTVLLPVTIGRPYSPFCSISELGLDAYSVQIIEFRVLRFPELLSSLPGVFWFNTRVCGAMVGRKIRQLIEFSEFDGCIVHGMRYLGLSLSWWRHLVPGRTVVVMHGRDPFFSSIDAQRYTRVIFNIAYSAADYIVLVGEPLLTHARSLGVPESKLMIVPNGSDVPSHQSVCDHQRVVADRRVIVSVSNLIALKGIQDNLHALANISSRREELKWEYRIVGDGPARIELKSLAKELGIEENILFLGRIPYEETMREISSCDIFCLPSWGEAFGIVYLEAMARMRPVIGCFENGAADIISNGKDGLLVPPRSIQDLTLALESLLDNPERCRELGVQARLTAKQFSWDVNVQRMLSLLGLSSKVVL